MWAFIVRRLLYNIPVYLGIILLVMLALRTKDPIPAMLGKHKTQEEYDAMAAELGLDQPFVVQFFSFLGDIVTLTFDQQSYNWKGQTAGDLLSSSVVPSLSITAPALVLSTLISIFVGLISSYYRGRVVDKSLVFFAVLGMSVSFLVYIMIGQYLLAYKLNAYLTTANDGRFAQFFAIEGYPRDGLDPSSWVKFCMLPVIISVVVTMGYDTRFYRAVMVEESTRDYITTARAKGATKRKIMFVHMLKNAMIPIITRVMITLPFLLAGSILLEVHFGIPGMGYTLITAINAGDFPVVQVFTAMFAALYIVTIILTDVLYALVDPRVRLS